MAAWVLFLKARNEIKKSISDVLRIIINPTSLYNFPENPVPPNKLVMP
jgi:hypothetical protein